jgi:hypothetical protein
MRVDKKRKYAGDHMIMPEISQSSSFEVMGNQRDAVGKEGD